MPITDADHRKETGSHFTPPQLADFVARRLVEGWLRHGSDQVPAILDPAVGDGQLLISLVGVLEERCIDVRSVTGYDTNGQVLQVARRRLEEDFPDLDVILEERDFLEIPFAEPGANHDLFGSEIPPKFDLIITNPPYVRTQVLGSDRAQAIARRFGLSGRVDLYHAFVRLYESVLRPEGVVGAILSNRFMVTQGGATTREFFLQHLPPIEVWDLGDTRLFEAAVLPCVVIASRMDQGVPPEFVSIYQSEPGGPAPNAADLFRVLEEEENNPSFSVRRGRLATDGSGGDVWRVETEQDAEWLDQVAHRTALTFGDVGAVRVGIKTTADAVFIRDDWEEVCDHGVPEVLMPLVTHHRAQPIRPVSGEISRRVLYTHEVENGKRRAIDLGKFPRAASYLEEHRERLSGRSYVSKANRAWYEIWVPQDPEAWGLSKVVFRDIADRPTFWLEKPGTVINGDCYWLVPGASGDPDLLWLILGVGNSQFALDFYDRRFQNRLYGGRRRFMTQYVEQFPLPDPTSAPAQGIVGEAQRLYEEVAEIGEENLARLDQLVLAAFGLG